VAKVREVNLEDWRRTIQHNDLGGLTA
jgi:hypothetical protein